MAKNLYNLTAVTTVNDSDLLHVNQGSVSSDKKVTKQNLLKEVNSSISSINNSLTNSCLRKADHYFSGSFTTNSSGYVLLGSIPSSFDVTISDFYVTFLIRGWSGGTGALSLVVGSNGTDLYLTSTPGTTVTGITVRLWYIKSVLA